MGMETTTAAAQNTVKYSLASVELSSHDFMPTATVNLSGSPSIMNDENMNSPHGAINAVRMV